MNIHKTVLVTAAARGPQVNTQRVTRRLDVKDTEEDIGYIGGLFRNDGVISYITR